MGYDNPLSTERKLAFSKVARVYMRVPEFPFHNLHLHQQCKHEGQQSDEVPATGGRKEIITTNHPSCSHDWPSCADLLKLRHRRCALLMATWSAQRCLVRQCKRALNKHQARSISYLYPSHIFCLMMVVYTCKYNPFAWLPWSYKYNTVRMVANRSRCDLA